MALDERTLEIETDAGDRVTALRTGPASPDALLALAHGAGAGMRHPFMAHLARGLAERGVATLRYQFPYMEAGRRGPDRPPRLVSTVRAAVAVGHDLAGGAPLFAGGKSLGGRMTSTAAAEDGWTPAGSTAVRGIAFFGFPLHPPGKPGTKRASHLVDVRVPMLFLQGTRDAFATPELLDPVVEGLDGARLYPVEGADHGFHVPKRSGRTDAGVLDDLAATTAGWMRERLGDAGG